MLGYLEMAVTTVGPAFDVTASQKVILACLAACSTWLTHMRHAFLSFQSKVGMLAMRSFVVVSVLLPHCFHIRLFVAFVIVQGFLYLGWQSWVRVWW